ncbi:hypothetical protein VNO78_02696 [Psophocarpus tetragonolobus]|uniref:Uncharacterized protein n=1 Tax=Psophocarpus tetragonolobus TaxID=3891 RepID=A0AAN9T099_PSOTE
MVDATSSSRTRKTQNYKPLVVSDDEILVAQVLMQLKEKRSIINNNDDVTGKRKKVSFSREAKVDRILPNYRTIENDTEVISHQKKMKKYRSLAILYMVTTPIIHSTKE